MKNKTDKKIENKLEEIIEQYCYLEYFEGVKKEELFDRAYKIKLSIEGKKLLNTEVQKAKKEDVRDFISWFNKIPNNQMIVFDETYKQYLQSLKDKDE